jgi:predicted enzyme related to lactoylglutathione lyase
MQVQGLVWAGTRTQRFDETVSFFREVLGVPLQRVGPGFAWGSMPDGSQLEVFGPDNHDHDEFSTGPVPEFLVDDLAAAFAELRDAGVKILGTPHVAPDEGWIHFRAPDGNVYGVTNGPQYRGRR